MGCCVERFLSEKGRCRKEKEGKDKKITGSIQFSTLYDIFVVYWRGIVFDTMGSFYVFY